MSVENEKEQAAPAASSFLGQLDAEITESVAGVSKVLPVGMTRRLVCRYEAIGDEEREEIRREARQAAKLAARVGKGNVDGERLGQARILATACLEVLAVTDEGEKSLGEVLRAEGVDCPATLRYNHDLVAALGGQVLADLGAKPTSTDLVTYLHRNGKSTQPLEAAAALYETWASGVTAETIADVLGQSV